MTDQATDGAAVDIPPLPSSGDVDFRLLRALVSEANCGVREDRGRKNPAIYSGHEMVSGINYNSLNRIVTGYARAQLTAATKRAEQAERMLAEAKPIETAKRDDKERLLWSGGWIVGYWLDGVGWWSGDSPITNPSHWLPCPADPAAIRSAASGEQG